MGASLAVAVAEEISEDCPKPVSNNNHNFIKVRHIYEILGQVEFNQDIFKRFNYSRNVLCGPDAFLLQLISNSNMSQ